MANQSFAQDPAKGTNSATMTKMTNIIENIDSQFSSGIFCTDAHAARYTGGRNITLANGKKVYCTSYNNLTPIDVLINPYFYQENRDINYNPFQSFKDYLNPLTIASTVFSKVLNRLQGIRLVDGESELYSYGINVSEINVGQEDDVETHRQRYLQWKIDRPNRSLIIYGQSRGAATAFNALAKYKYQEVKLAIFEACFYSMQDALATDYLYPISWALNNGIGLFTKYKKDGMCPGCNIDSFPENVPVVFITSAKDVIVPAWSTKRLADELAERGKNDVYLLELKNSSHPNYIFDDIEDRNNYESFIHAIYKRYHLPHNPELAAKGQSLLEQALRYEVRRETTVNFSL